MIKDVQLRKTNPSASDIWHHIRVKDFSKEYTYIILGRPGPTGKTTLCSRLRRLGYKAFEIAEEVLPYCRFESDRNAFVVNEYEKHVIIVLNQHVR